MIFILLSPPHPQSSLSVVSVREETLLRAIGHLHFEVAKGSFTKAAGHHGSLGYQGAQTHHIPSWQPSRLLLPHTSFFGSTASGPQPRSQPPYPSHRVVKAIINTVEGREISAQPPARRSSMCQRHSQHGGERRVHINPQGSGKQQRLNRSGWLKPIWSFVAQ